MKQNQAADKMSAITELIFETFRLHGRLIAFGDQMAEAWGLTSARWQILGSVVLSEVSVTVSDIARNLGLSRQAIQRVVNDLESLSFVRLEENPHHKRARLVRLTDRGLKVYGEVDEKFNAWVHSVAADVDLASLGEAQGVMRNLRGHCETNIEIVSKGVSK